MVEKVHPDTNTVLNKIWKKALGKRMFLKALRGESKVKMRERKEALLRREDPEKQAIDTLTKQKKRLGSAT